MTVYKWMPYTGLGAKRDRYAMDIYMTMSPWLRAKAKAHTHLV